MREMYPASPARRASACVFASVPVRVAFFEDRMTTFAAAQNHPAVDDTTTSLAVDGPRERPRPSGTEYGIDDTPVPFADLESACPTTDVTAARRLDPYWHGLWGDGSQASWLSRSLLERLGTDRVSRVRDADTSRTREQAITEILTRRRQARLTALAAVGMWRTVTAEQLAAITGLRTILDGREMRPAFQAELVERGTLITELGWRGPPRSVQLYRPVGTGLDPITDVLRYADWVAVTGGYPWTRGHQQDRHNLLATELGLRVAEHCDVGRGPRRIAVPARPALPRLPAATPANRCADLTVIRPDGMRIAVEITGSISTEFARKADRWAELLAGTDPDRTGLAVVFVDAAPPDRGEQVAAEMWRTIRTQVARAAHQVPGSAEARVPERMAAARWQWWFPASRTGSAAFRTLQCVRPTGTAADRWDTVDLLDPADLRAPPDDHRRRRGGRELRRPARRPALAPRPAPGTRLRPGAAPPRRHHRRPETAVPGPGHHAPHHDRTPQRPAGLADGPST